MIIACNNCHKKFNLDANLIPGKGRLLQCNSCNHEWFFKREIIDEPINTTITQKKEAIELLDDTPKYKTDILDNAHVNEIVNNKEEKPTIEPLQQTKKQKNYRILNLLVITLISLVAFIIVLDTFKSPIGKIVPNIELLLYNLYETFKDVSLFIKDLF